MLLIITPDAFLQEAVRLKEHKENTGVLTTVVPLSTVYKSYSGRDEAEKVKRCIAALHAPNGIRYVLLLGDSDMMPVRYTKTDRRSDDAADTAFYATDLYYAALYRAMVLLTTGMRMAMGIIGNCTERATRGRSTSTGSA